jgi:serine/threonine protein kinase
MIELNEPFLKAEDLVDPVFINSNGTLMIGAFSIASRLHEGTDTENVHSCEDLGENLVRPQVWTPLTRAGTKCPYLMVPTMYLRIDTRYIPGYPRCSEEDILVFYTFVQGEKADIFFKTKSFIEYSLQEQLRMIQTLCQALEALHHEGLVHRGIKPDNIWVVNTEEGYIFMLGDCEMCTPLGEIPFGRLAGRVNIDFSPREQLRSQPAMVETDIYSLGITIARLLTQTNNIVGGGWNLSEECYQRIVEHFYGHREVANILKKAIQEEPEKRFRSTREFFTALENAYQEMEGQMVP